MKPATCILAQMFDFCMALMLQLTGAPRSPEVGGRLTRGRAG